MYNTNNYGYNPYGTYMPQRPIQQPVQQQVITPQQNNLYGKLVSDIETAKILEYPLDGSTAYFPLTDGSGIITKQLQMDGTSKITIFKPITEEKSEKRYITHDDMKKALNEYKNDDIDEIKEEIKEIKKTIKELKKKGE